MGPRSNLQTFSFKGNAYASVAESRGDSRPGRILVIGAHYDTVPGADDNARMVPVVEGLKAGIERWGSETAHPY